MNIRQIRSKDGTGTLSYFLTDRKAGVGVLIDPNLEDLGELTTEIQRTGVKLTHIVETHTHVDHVSASGSLKKSYGAEIVMHENTKNKWKVLDQGDRFGIGDTLRANAAITIDRYVHDQDLVESGEISILCLHTPGHTDNHLALLAGDWLFTGDLLLIGQAGRSDLPGGDPGQQYDSLFQKIMPLSDHLRMYPGHDYDNQEFSLLGEEKKKNPFLRKRTRDEYIEFVSDFFPPIAEIVGPGGKMSLQCGTQRVIHADENVRSISPQELAEKLRAKNPPLVLDVREPRELVMLGAIDGVLNIPVAQLATRISELPGGKDTPMVCVCQSGSRSLEATHYLQQQGYTNVLNLTGGTGNWVRNGFPVKRPGVSEAPVP